MSDQNNVSLYGPGAITSGELTAEEIELVEKSQNAGVRVNDGDEQIDIDIAEDEAEGTPEGESAEGPEGAEGDLPNTDDAPADVELVKKVTESQTALEEISKDLTSKGVDVDALMAEFNEHDGLSKASYEALEKAGMSRVIVDSIIAGQVAVANSFANSLLATAGGEKGLEVLAQFAVSTDPASVDAYNNAVDRKDLATAKALLNSWKAQRTAKLGTANKQITGKPSPSAKTVKGFTDRQEMTKAMSDPRYGRDPKFTREVEQKVGASSFF